MTSSPGKTYNMSAYPVQVAVRSEHDGAAAYMVHLPYCPCADFTNRKGRVSEDGTAITICKHLRQALELAGWHRPASPASPEPELHVNLNRGAALAILTAHMATATAETLLTKVTTGAPARRPSQRGRFGEVVVHVHAGRVRLYDIEVYPVPS